MENKSNPGITTSIPVVKHTISNVGIYSNFQDNSALKTFFTDILSNLNTEFNIYLEYTEDLDLFEYNERVFVGFFNNAIIRSDKDKRFSTLQEYVIYKVGRADLLVVDNNTKTYLLIEAKKKGVWPADQLIQWMMNESTEKLSDLIHKQAKIYFKAEENFYLKEGAKSYLCAIYFELISNINTKDLSNISPDKLSNLENSFYTVYYLNSNDENNQSDISKIGLAVYGHLIKSSDLK